MREVMKSHFKKKHPYEDFPELTYYDFKVGPGEKNAPKKIKEEPLEVESESGEETYESDEEEDRKKVLNVIYSTKRKGRC
jgi:hypothetical protein